MGVSINYKGRFGNHLFQYVAARLFADDHELKMQTEFDDPDLVRMTPQMKGSEVPGPATLITDEDNIFGRRLPSGNYTFDGFFQNSEYFYSRRPEILNFAHTTSVPTKNQDDLVLNIRAGIDYKALGWVIDPSWYLEILRKETFRKLHIVIDEMDHDYLAHFQEFEPIVVAGGKNEDWNYLRSFEKVICSNSTFCWWAMFFSAPAKIYMFKRWVGFDWHVISIPGSVEVDGKFTRELKAG